MVKIPEREVHIVCPLVQAYFVMQFSLHTSSLLEQTTGLRSHGVGTGWNTCPRFEEFLGHFLKHSNKTYETSSAFYEGDDTHITCFRRQRCLDFRELVVLFFLRVGDECSDCFDEDLVVVIVRSTRGIGFVDEFLDFGVLFFVVSLSITKSE